MDAVYVITFLVLGWCLWRLRKVKKAEYRTLGYVVVVTILALTITGIVTDGKYLSGSQITLCFIVLFGLLFGLSRVTPAASRNAPLVVVIGCLCALVILMVGGLEYIPQTKKMNPTLRTDLRPQLAPPAVPKTVAAEHSKDFREIALIEEAKDAIRSRLKDPSSAQFRNVKYHFSKNVGHVICGQVNAKNSYGGYNGYTRFVSNGQPDVTFMANETTDFGVVWQKICVE